MKKILLIVLVLIAGCAKEPIDTKTLDRRKGIFYTKDTNEPYTGAVFELYSSGEKEGEGYLKDGEEDGKYTWYYENGQIKEVCNHKYGKQDGKRTAYYENGQIYEEGNWKRGKPDGKWTTYNKDGSIDRVSKWKDGVWVE